MSNLQLAELAKTIGDEFDKQLGDLEDERATVFCERMRKSLRKSVGVTDDVEQLRSLMALSKLVREEADQMEAEANELMKANGQSVATAQTATGQPINIALSVDLIQPSVQRKITVNRDLDGDVQSVDVTEVPKQVATPVLAPDAYNPNSYL